MSEGSKLSVLWASPETSDFCATIGEESGYRIRSSGTRSARMPPPLVSVITKTEGTWRDKSLELPFLLDSECGINERKRTTIYKLIYEDKNILQGMITVVREGLSLVFCPRIIVH